MNISVEYLSFTQPFKINKTTYQIFITHKDHQGVYAILLIENGEFKYYRTHKKDTNEDKIVETFEQYIGTQLGLFKVKSNLEATLNYTVKYKDENGNEKEEHKSVTREI
jgi:tellurite resistance-related uncharacterized protein